jgi:predicted choloylglycine hydrolase
MRHKGTDMDKTAVAEPYRSRRAVLQDLLDLRPSLGLVRATVSAEDAVARGLAVAKVYAFASVDYPGAAQSVVLDSDGTTAVGAFDFDPSIDRRSAFTFAGGVTRFSRSRARP